MPDPAGSPILPPPTGALQRLHGAWDTEAGRAWCQSLPALLARAPTEAAFYRGRNTLYRLAGVDRPVVIKAFGNGRWWRRGRGPMKATASYDHALRLVRLGFGTPEPLAVVYARGTGGYYVCAWEDGCRSVWDLHDGLIPTQHATALAEMVAKLHEAGVHHLDLTPGNVLLKPVGNAFEFLLVDCNRMRFGPVSLSTGLAALAKLECHGQLLKAYAAARGADLARAQRIFARVTLLERTTRRMKDATRPLRRRVGL